MRVLLIEKLERMFHKVPVLIYNVKNIGDRLWVLVTVWKTKAKMITKIKAHQQGGFGL